jgi:hypothetical protein
VSIDISERTLQSAIDEAIKRFMVVGTGKMRGHQSDLPVPKAIGRD